MKLLTLSLLALTLLGCKQYELKPVNDNYSIHRLQDYACSQHFGVKEYSPVDVPFVECKEMNIWKKWGQRV